MFGKLKSILSGAGNRVAGRTDILEAVCASAALVAAADGNIDDGEVAAALGVVNNNEVLSAAFDAGTIERTMDKMLKRAQGGFSGRAGLYKEIDDIGGKDFADREITYLIALDVAHADGEVGDKEKKTLDQIATRLKVDPSKYAA